MTKHISREDIKEGIKSIKFYGLNKYKEGCCMKLLILEIDEPVGIHRFKIGDKVQIKSERMNIHFDYVKVRGIVDLNV